MNECNPEEIKQFVSRSLFDEKVILSADSLWPRISIITPSYNQGEFLERTILSVLNQNYPNLEYIIIDGGSKDNSVEVIRKYEKYLTYWVSEKDNGQSDALNKGFSMATGHIIGWQNSDDIYLPGTFLKIAKLFNANDNYDIIYGNRIDVDENDNITGECRFTPFSLTVYWYDGMSLSNQSTFWKRSLFDRIGMLDTRFQIIMDYEFFLRAGLRKARFKYVPIFMGGIRRHNESKTSTLFCTPAFRAEYNSINVIYNRKTYLNVPLRLYSMIRRTTLYFFQGDWDYIIKGFKRRMR